MPLTSRDSWSRSLRGVTKLSTRFPALLCGPDHPVPVHDLRIAMADKQQLFLLQHVVRLLDVNPFIMCPICSGYLVDATTITECLHTFCKSCIVKHFESSNRCPKCNMVVHQTIPHYNIRSDGTMQDIVNKMVPNLEENEKQRMREFYFSRGMELPKPVYQNPPVTDKKKSSEKKRGILAPGRICSTTTAPMVCLVLECLESGSGRQNYQPLQKKFVSVSGEATVKHVKAFLRKKLQLDSLCEVIISCGDRVLEQDCTLNCLQCSSSMTQGELLLLHYCLSSSQYKCEDSK
uniref:Polycomb group ring finger 6 n=1 Tax=Eptatretus burgeri TaxID=7764 RepID=A0A8C4PX70_EPTBU